MIIFTVYRDSQGKYKGFLCEGHAEYSESGSDIVCSAVSILTINTANAIEQFTDTCFYQDCESGHLSISFPDGCDSGAELLMDTLVLGIEGIRSSYTEYVDIIYKEVT